MSQTETGEVDVSLALEERLSELGFDVSDPEAVLEALSQVTLVPKHPTNQQLVEYAQAVLAHEGEIEFDDDAAVSRSDDNGHRGAYVAAWVWVEDEACQAFFTVESDDESDTEDA